MINLWLLVFVAVAAFAALKEDSPTLALPIGALNAQDKQHFKEVFSSFKKDNIKEAHYAHIGGSVFGVKSLEGVPCDILKTLFDSSDLEMQYYALSAARGVKSCTPQIAQPNRLNEALKRENLTADNLYYIVASASLAGIPIDKVEVLKLLKKFAAKETSPSSLSSILASATLVKGATEQELEVFSHLVKKITEQADEADGNILFFERGAYTTAFAIESIFLFSAAMKKAPALTEQEVIKFYNFLYERRRAHQIRTSARLASAFKILATNSFMNPVVVYGATASERAGESGILITQSRRLQLRFFDVLGNQLDAGVVVRAGSLIPVSEGAKPFGHAGELRHFNNMFELDLAKVGTLSCGRYSLELTVTQKEKNLVGVSKAMIPLRVVSPVKVNKAHLKVQDASRTLLDTALNYPGKAEVVRMDQSARLRLTFELEDGVAATMLSAPVPQQAFIQLTNSKTSQSITFLAKRSTTDGTHTFTMSLESAAQDFDYVSGLYKMEVLVGDSLIESPIVWHVADVTLQFPVHGDLSKPAAYSSEDVARLTVASQAARKRSAHPLIGETPRSNKPLLEHTFRTPEPRPSNLLAYTFTGLCCAPLVILVFAWPIMGANLSNMPCTLSGLLFHLGLGAIFALYLVYWFQLNMFTTLKYLFYLGVFTFVTGNRLLRQLVTRRKAQE
nr:ormdl protein [Hymenolepis microstoma]